MSFTSVLPRDDDGRVAARPVLADGLLVWEWLFLLFVFTIASYALSLQPTLQSLAWYLIYLAALGLFVLRYGAFLHALWFAAPLLLWPTVAGLSYVWSEVPGHTLRSAVQLTMTVLISIYLGARFSLFDLARALFLVLLVTGLVSLVGILAHSGFAYDHNGIARGIFPHKNELGGRMVMLLLCCILLFVRGWHRIVVAAAGAMALALIAISHSGTSIVMTLGICALAPVLLSRHEPAPLRLLAYISALLLVCGFAWVLLAFNLDPVDMALDALGKNRTLTGRSVLWDFASGLIEKRPLLGDGFDAFWNGPGGSAGHYLQYVLKQEIMNFHDSYVDITVQLGFVGLALTGLVMLLFAWHAVAMLYRSRGAVAALPAFFLIFITVYSLTEYALFRQHDLLQILFGTLYVSAALPGPSRRQASPASWPET